jgi:hypothetical protein
MRVKDYNTIKWDDYFYLDETSPSGLRWKHDQLFGSKVNAPKDGVAGWLYNSDNRLFSRWRVILKRKYYMVHRVMMVMLNGYIDSKLVVDHLDGNSTNNTISNLEIKSQKANMQNTRRNPRNTSGIAGVNLITERIKDYTYMYWVASWRINNKRYYKRFSVSKLGNDKAFALVTEYRFEQIKLLNENGEDYTHRHVYG